MTEDQKSLMIYHLGHIEKMRKIIEQKIQKLILDKADDAHEGFRGIEEDADELWEYRVDALMSIAKDAGLDINFSDALSTMRLEAEDISSTANEAAGVLEEMEGEEGDEVQGVVEDYLGTIDTSNEAIYKAVGEIKEGVQNHKKYWVSDDRQSDMGAWPLSTSDEEIWADLVRDTGTSREEMGGRIKVGDWTDWTTRARVPTSWRNR